MKIHLKVMLINAYKLQIIVFFNRSNRSRDLWTSMAFLTQKLSYSSLITEVLNQQLIANTHHRSEHTNAISHLRLLAATSTGAMETVTLPTERV